MRRFCRRGESKVEAISTLRGVPSSFLFLSGLSFRLNESSLASLPSLSDSPKARSAILTLGMDCSLVAVLGKYSRGLVKVGVSMSESVTLISSIASFLASSSVTLSSSKWFGSSDLLFLILFFHILAALLTALVCNATCARAGVFVIGVWAFGVLCRRSLAVSTLPASRAAMDDLNISCMLSLELGPSSRARLNKSSDSLSFC
mmetsp:Transcript_7804/g.13156  ORF Transcript_7804/g.13156 Transcript_7804/m.13156 type:complete len:203 (-) Transcript_7804:645-1253(-)